MQAEVSHDSTHISGVALSDYDEPVLVTTMV
jgi:hypothetical protein